MASCGDNHHDDGPWGRKGILPYTLARTAKSRSGLVSTSNVNGGKKKKKEKKLVVLSKLGCLPRGCIHPTTIPRPLKHLLKPPHTIQPSW
jgi:hypothetical protein